MSIQRTTVRLNGALLTRAKRQAARRGTTLTAMMEQGLQLALQNPTPKPRRVRLPVWNSGGTLPGVDISNSARLLDLMETGE